MSTAVPMKEKAIALTSNAYLNSTNKFIRTGSASHIQTDPTSQQSLPSFHSPQKNNDSLGKGRIQRTPASKLPELPLKTDRPNVNQTPKPQNSSSPPKGSPEDIAMHIAASIFLSSTTKFVKGLLGKPSQTERTTLDLKEQNQKAGSPAKKTGNIKNPEENTHKTNTDRHSSSTAKILQNYNAIVNNKKQSPTNNQPSNSSPPKPQLTPKLINKHQDKTPAAERRSSPNRSPFPNIQKPMIQFKGVTQGENTERKEIHRNPEENAYKMAGQQFLSSTTKFVKHIPILPSNDSAVKVEPRKGMSSPPQRLHTELSFTPIKSNIGIESTPDLSKPNNTHIRSRLHTETSKNQTDLNQKTSEDNTRRIQRKSTKAREIKFTQKKENEEPVSILNYNNGNSAESQRPTTEKSKQIQPKDSNIKATKPNTVAHVTQRSQSPQKTVLPNNLQGNRSQPKFIANFSNNQSRIEENNQQIQMAATKKAPFARQNAKNNKQASQQTLLKSSPKIETKSQKNIEVPKAETLKKAQNASLQINATNPQHLKASRFDSNASNVKKPNQTITEGQKKVSNQVGKSHKQGLKQSSQLKKEESKFNKNKVNERPMPKVEEEGSIKVKTAATKTTNENHNLYSAKSKQPKKNQTETSKLNNVKSAQNFESLWARPSHPRKVTQAAVTQSQKQIPLSNPRQVIKLPQSQTQINIINNKQLANKQKAESSKNITSQISIKDIKTQNASTPSAKIQIDAQTQQSLNKKMKSDNKISTNVAKNGNLSTTQTQKTEIVTPKSIKSKESLTQSDKSPQIALSNLKRSQLLLYTCAKLTLNRKKTAFAAIKDKSLFELKHKRQATILAYAVNGIVSTLVQNNLFQGFQRLKRSLLAFTDTKKLLEANYGNRKQQGASLLFRVFTHKQKQFFDKINHYSWATKQLSVNNLIAGYKQAESKKQQYKNESAIKKELGNLVMIIKNYNLGKVRKAFDRIAYAVFTVAPAKKTIESTPTPKKNVGYSKSPQKPIRNYAQERKTLLQNKADVESQIQRVQYRISDKKRFVEFERAKLIKKMDQLTKTVTKFEAEVLNKRKRTQELQTLICNLGDVYYELDLSESEPLLQTLTKMYSDLLKNSNDTIHYETIVEKYKIKKEEGSPLVQQWNTLMQNAELKRQIGLWEGYEAKEQQMRKKLKDQQELQCKVLRSYVRERYLWQWLHSAVVRM